VNEHVNLQPVIWGFNDCCWHPFSRVLFVWPCLLFQCHWEVLEVFQPAIVGV